VGVGKPDPLEANTVWSSRVPLLRIYISRRRREDCVDFPGNGRLTGALLDRLTHRVHILEANGESFRLKEAKRHGKPKECK